MIETSVMSESVFLALRKSPKPKAFAAFLKTLIDDADSMIVKADITNKNDRALAKLFLTSSHLGYDESIHLFLHDTLRGLIAQ